MKSDNEFCGGGWSLYARASYALAWVGLRLTTLAEWCLKKHAKKCGCPDCKTFLVMRAIGPLLARHGRAEVLVERRPS